MTSTIRFSHVDPGSPIDGNKTYEDFVVAYWNWLLGPDADNYVQSPFNFDVVFMRTSIDYRFVVDGNGTVTRQNFSSGPNTAEINIRRNTPIFMAVLDTCYYSGYKDEFNHRPLNEEQMRRLCRRDNDNNSPTPSPPTIEREGDPASSRINIVPSTIDFRMEIPVNGTFQLFLSDADLRNSKLVQKMEHLILPDPGQQFDFQAVAVGYYVVVKIQDTGRYVIRNTAIGTNQYTSNMVYTFSMQ